jgi:hypothetical protein
VEEVMLPPLAEGDPLDVLELERGQEWIQVFEYMDGHRETGVVRYTGNTRSVWVNDHERITLPDLLAITPLTGGPVRVVRSA